MKFYTYNKMPNWDAPPMIRRTTVNRHDTIESCESSDLENAPVPVQLLAATPAMLTPFMLSTKPANSSTTSKKLQKLAYQEIIIIWPRIIIEHVVEGGNFHGDCSTEVRTMAEWSMRAHARSSRATSTAI